MKEIARNIEIQNLIGNYILLPSYETRISTGREQWEVILTEGKSKWITIKVSRITSDENENTNRVIRVNDTSQSVPGMKMFKIRMNELRSWRMKGCTALFYLLTYR